MRLLNSEKKIAFKVFKINFFAFKDFAVANNFLVQGKRRKTPLILFDDNLFFAVPIFKKKLRSSNSEKHFFAHALNFLRIYRFAALHLFR